MADPTIAVSGIMPDIEIEIDEHFSIQYEALLGDRVVQKTSCTVARPVPESIQDTTDSAGRTLLAAVSKHNTTVRAYAPGAALLPSTMCPDHKGMEEASLHCYMMIFGRYSAIVPPPAGYETICKYDRWTTIAQSGNSLVFGEGASLLVVVPDEAAAQTVEKLFRDAGFELNRGKADALDVRQAVECDLHVKQICGALILTADDEAWGGAILASVVANFMKQCPDFPQPRYAQGSLTMNLLSQFPSYFPHFTAFPYKVPVIGFYSYWAMAAFTMNRIGHKSYFNKFLKRCSARFQDTKLAYADLSEVDFSSFSDQTEATVWEYYSTQKGYRNYTVPIKTWNACHHAMTRLYDEAEVYAWAKKYTGADCSTVRLTIYSMVTELLASSGNRWISMIIAACNRLNDKLKNLWKPMTDEIVQFEELTGTLLVNYKNFNYVPPSVIKNNGLVQSRFPCLYSWFGVIVHHCKGSMGQIDVTQKNLLKGYLDLGTPLGRLLDLLTKYVKMNEVVDLRSIDLDAIEAAALLVAEEDTQEPIQQRPAPRVKPPTPLTAKIGTPDTSPRQKIEQDQLLSPTPSFGFDIPPEALEVAEAFADAQEPVQTPTETPEPDKHKRKIKVEAGGVEYNIRGYSHESTRKLQYTLNQGKKQTNLYVGFIVTPDWVDRLESLATSDPLLVSIVGAVAVWIGTQVAEPDAVAIFKALAPILDPLLPLDHIEIRWATESSTTYIAVSKDGKAKREKKPAP
eukprot:Blabericola_migrator_1__5191@NODE_2677_length_2475_cov_23_738787_g1675_i0_p1_GENE_NODE_2677_length_2475_cov_23_738787_g1675_i0NODE_2677_length_2475_cov_23_738787_g1675_i0_p1_ORF_typecomplete_len748_score114_10_NODE_2677_length_2475_cov_23_738787_g1675_i02302449